MSATPLPRDPNNLPSMVANADGTAGVIGLDSAGNARMVGKRGTLTTGTQITVGTTPTQLLAANAARLAATFQVISGSAVYLGGSNGVSVSNAPYTASAGNVVSDDVTIGAWWAVCASGTALVGVAEVS